MTYATKIRDFLWSLLEHPDDLDDRLDTYINRGVDEGPHLDFKQVVGLKKVKAQVAEATTGFANADGGVLLFGIQDKKNADGDHHVLMPVHRNQAGADIGDQILRCAADSAEPVVNVDAVWLPSARREGRGYVALYVPETEHVHKVRLSKPTDKQGRTLYGRYFVRVGDQFVEPNQDLLDWMLRGRRAPRLELRLVELRHYGDEVHAFVRLLNVGRRAARSPIVYFPHYTGIKRPDPNTSMTRMELLSFGGHTPWFPGVVSMMRTMPATSVLHAGTSEDFWGPVLTEKFLEAGRPLFAAFAAEETSPMVVSCDVIEEPHDGGETRLVVVDDPLAFQAESPTAE